jgi:hypothetical protein
VSFGKEIFFSQKLKIFKATGKYQSESTDEKL